MSNKLLIFGGSGHAKDVIATAKELGYRTFEIVTTDGSCDIPEHASIKEEDMDVSKYSDWHCIAAIGNNAHRARFLKDYGKRLNFTNIVATNATIRESATLGKGCYVGPFAYIGPYSQIDDNCIINTHAVIGHDVRIQANTHVAPKTCISGHVDVGRAVFIGVGTTVNNGSPDAPLQIPDEVHIGMGCIVTDSIKQSGIRLIPKPNYMMIK